jgi:hypothetical protein
VTFSFLKAVCFLGSGWCVSLVYRTEAEDSTGHDHVVTALKSVEEVLGTELEKEFSEASKNTLQIIAAPPTAISIPIVCQAINVKARCSATAGSDGLQTCSWYKGDLHHKLVGSGHAWTHCEFWRDRMGLTAAP